MVTSYPFHESLTPRETDILLGIVAGQTNAEIAERLVLSIGTVKWYVKQLYGNLGAHSREQAVKQALTLGLVKAPSPTDHPLNNSETVCPLINPLPQDVSDRYIGNTEKLELLESLLQQHVRLISIYGRAGSGKTALACKALSDLRQSERSAQQLTGIVCLTATNMDITLNRLFNDLGRLLAETDQALLQAVARNNELIPLQKIRILLEKISNKQIVLLLDNLESIQNMETGELNELGLQQFIETSVMQSRVLTVLITSREPLNLPRQLKTWEYSISLEDGLPREDAITLLRRFDPSGLAGLRDAPTEELLEVAEQLDGFPRALESVAGMLLEDPLLRLADIKQTVSGLEGEISAAVVEQALAHLDQISLQILQALAVFGQLVSYEALAGLLTPFMSEATLRPRLSRLVRAGFVKANRETLQFSLHPIDQAYCYSKIMVGNPGQGETGPLPFTRATLHARAALYYREKRLPRSAWKRISDLEPQLNEFKHWVNAGDGDEAAQVLLEIDQDYLWEWEFKDLLRQSYTTLSGQVKDPHLAHHVARRLAWLKFFDGTDASEKEFRKLLDEAKRYNFVKEEADALDDLAQIFRRGNRNAYQGIEYHQQALALYRRLKDRRGEANALGGLGAIFAFIEPEDAIDYLLEAADIQRDLGNLSSLSFLMTTLGTAYENMGSLEQARKIFEEGIVIARQNTSLEALSRAYGCLAELYVLTGEKERVYPILEEAIATTREFCGVPMTGQLIFFIGRTAFYMALADDISEGIELLEQAIREAASVQPHLVLVGNFFLSLILTLDGNFQRARSLLPPEPENLLSRGVGNSFWVGALLIKTGEFDTAVAFLKNTLTMSRSNAPSTVEARYLDKSTLSMRALALAGLSLLNQDREMAAEAAELTRQMMKIRNWQNNLHRRLIDLLIQESGGEILLPIREAFVSTLG